MFVQYRTKEGDERPATDGESLTTARWEARRLLAEETAVRVRIGAGERLVEEWTRDEDGRYRVVTG